MAKWSFLALLLLLLAASTSAFCPSECHCNPTVGIVRCEALNRDHFAIDIPVNTTVLHLKGYSFSSLSDLPSLPPLTSLLISHAAFEYIPETFLDSFPSLRHLSLERNDIRVIHPIARKPSQLQILELRHNKIAFVSASTFTNLPALHTLDLSFNELRSLTPSIVEKATALRQLRLHENPLNCDCRLKPFLSLISSNNSSEAHCTSPLHMRYKNVATLEASQLYCPSARLVSSNSSSKQLACLYGKSSIWLYKNRDINRSHKVLDDGHLEIGRGDDEVDFTCARDEEQQIVRPQLNPSWKRCESDRGRWITCRKRDSDRDFVVCVFNCIISCISIRFWPL